MFSKSMPSPRPFLRLTLLATLATPALIAQEPNSHNFFPGISATSTKTPFPGISATATTSPMAGVVPSPIASTPLAASPTVLALEHREPVQMNEVDNQLLSIRRTELSQAAALAGFDISQADWHYQQVVCPALPNDVLLQFAQGPGAAGSSRFAAVVPRDSAAVRIVSTYAHGLLPFEASWSKPGSFAVFNGMLRRQRGQTPLSQAPNWLMIGMCFAELSGYPVQVVSTLPNPGPTLDLLRLDANRPQLRIASDQSADITFSDVSRPAATTNWTLHFNQQGEIIAADQGTVRQPPAIALKP
jgi:hypothetical protein